MIFGSNPVDLCGWGGEDEVLTLAQGAGLSGQFAQQGKLRVMTEEAVLKDTAKSRLRRLLAFNKSSTCADVKLGDAALFHKAQSKEGALRRRGPVLISDIDETDVAMKFQAQISKVARFRVRKKGGGERCGGG